MVLPEMDAKLKRLGVQVDLVQPLPIATAGPPLIRSMRSAISHFWTRAGLRPVIAFVLLSLAFGAATVFVLPPLRGPDEIAHFLRIHSYTRGELLPAAEVDGRKGIFVNRDLYNQLRFFKDAGEWFARDRDQGIRYGQIMALYREFGGRIGDEFDKGPMFLPFAGTEGYNPVAYAPYIIAGVIARPLGLEFPDMLLLMRLFGLVTFTAAAAYAIAVTPVLKWAFLLIALLPVAIYNRSVLSADGATLSSALVITALSLNALRKSAAPIWLRSFWMTVCALCKQPQIVFALLELLIYPVKELPRRLTSVAIVVLPSLVLSPLWVVAVSAEIAAWRLQIEGHHPPEHFDPVWKIFYMWEHPAHFPLALWRTLNLWGDRLWQELIGILGWQDIILQPWTYVVLTVLLMLVPLEQLQLNGSTRARVIVITGLTALSYVILVYLIFFLTYTPLDVDHVRGVQGRYFVIALPVVAIFVAAIVNVRLPAGVLAIIATVGATISGVTTVEAVFRAHW
jgi:Predicted membrane protein (DUF2142)